MNPSVFLSYKWTLKQTMFLSLALTTSRGEGKLNPAVPHLKEWSLIEARLWLRILLNKHIHACIHTYMQTILHTHTHTHTKEAYNQVLLKASVPARSPKLSIAKPVQYLFGRWNRKNLLHTALGLCDSFVNKNIHKLTPTRIHVDTDTQMC